jgi:serine/threonine protein kinase
VFSSLPAALRTGDAHLTARTSLSACAQPQARSRARPDHWPSAFRGNLPSWIGTRSRIQIDATWAVLPCPGLRHEEVSQILKRLRGVLPMTAMKSLLGAVRRSQRGRRGGALSEDFPAVAGFGAGSLVAGYRLEAQVGVGGMAVVFRARDERLGRHVALKILTPALAADAAFRRRFIAESRAAAAVDDPHIIPVYEAGEAGGVLFIAMRFVRGGDLRLVLDREGALPPGRVAGFVSPVASALDAAHGVGLVHRDVKPANILVDAREDRPDHVYLSDFGVSKGAVSSVSLTGAGHFVGTPDYSAPEQIQGWAVDGRTDQYALACVAYQLLTGATPFERDQGMAVLLAHLSQPPPPVSSRRPDLPAAADEVLARGMAKAPEKRYGSCRDFAEALREALGLAPYHSTGSIPAANHPRTETAAPRPEFSEPDLAGAGKAGVPTGPEAPATTDWVPVSGSASPVDVPAAAVIATGLADTGTHSETVPSAATAGRSGVLSGESDRLAADADGPSSGTDRPGPRVAWIRRHRLLVIVLAGAVLAAAAVVPFVLASSTISYAAIVGNQQITIATFDSEVANLSQAVKRYPGTVQLSPTQETHQTLTWLVRFRINDEVARQQGITVSTAQAQKALNEIYTQAKVNAQAQGISKVTLDLIMAANGIPPNLSAKVGRYQAITDQFALRANNGKAPTTTSAQSATTTKLQHAQCVAAKSLSIRINPQFGRMDYAQFAVVATSSTVSPTTGSTPTPAPSGLTPAC